MDLDGAGQAHRDLKAAIGAASRSGLTTERDRRWGSLAERMLARCQANVATAQRRTLDGLQLLESERRREDAYRQPDELLDRV